uniref:Ig-like domain-containing protein n=1 Tax=Cyprinus carpio carpio TaxID=630221 RepID=A0A8C1BJF6_CYPCA
QLWSNVKDLCNVIPLLPAYGFYLTHVFVNFCVLFSFTDVSGISLTSSPAQNKRPGETVKISCKTSGFTMTDYWMQWNLQKPGKDVSQSTQYLEAKSLREKDTAVYYCARQTH